MTRARGSSFRRDAVLASLGALSLCACWEPTKEIQAPNVVLLVIDSLRADHVGAYGYPRETAPHLASLAREGLLFEKALAPSSFTKTSMASAFTAQSPLSHGVYGERDGFDPAGASLVEQLRGAGYRTLGVSANPWVSPAFGFSAGFDAFENLNAADAQRVNQVVLGLVDEEPSASASAPLFVFAHYMDAHAPYRAGPDRLGLGADIPPLPTDVASDAELERAFRRGERDGFAERARVGALYDAGIRRADRGVGSLLDALRERGHLADAIVAVVSDHGEALGEHGAVGHGRNLYPEALRIPWILWAPGRLEPGVRITRRVGLVQLAPTLLDLAGLPGSPRFEVESATGSQTEPPLRVAVGPNPMIPGRHLRAVFAEEALFVWEPQTGHTELYDLSRDPGAERSLATSADRLQTLVTILADPTEAVDPAAQTRPLPEATRDDLRALGYEVRADAAALR